MNPNELRKAALGIPEEYQSIVKELLETIDLQLKMICWLEQRLDQGKGRQ